MLVERVNSIRPSRIGRTRQDVRVLHHHDDVRSVSTTSALSVVRVNRPTLDRRQGRLDIPTLVERVRVNVDLDIILVTDIERAINHLGRRSPVLVDLETARPSLDNIAYGLLARVVALAGKAKVERDTVRRGHHVLHVKLGGRASRGLGAVRRARSAADDRGDSVCHRLFPDLRTDEVDMHVECTGRDDVFLACNGLPSESSLMGCSPPWPTRRSCRPSRRPCNLGSQLCRYRQSSHS